MRVEATIESLLYPTVQLDTIRCNDPTFAAFLVKKKPSKQARNSLCNRYDRSNGPLYWLERALSIEQRKARGTKS